MLLAGIASAGDAAQALSRQAQPHAAQTIYAVHR